MQILAIPFPVVRFLRRLFNVVTSLTISNQYLLVQKADRECDVAGTKNGSGTGMSFIWPLFIDQYFTILDL